MTHKLQSQLRFLVEADKMKSIYRQAILTDMSRRETDAEHSWHFALTALTLYEYAADKSVDIDRVIKMALVHDLVEVYAGDTPAYDVAGNLDKEERELAAAERLFGMLPEAQGEEYRKLWLEFDEMQSPDALYASAIDRFQAYLIMIETVNADGHAWAKFNVTADKIYARMSPIRKALPELWSFVESETEKAVQNGYVLPAVQ